MRRRVKTAFPFYFFILSLLLCVVITGCKHEYPPFDEYQVVGFVPIDSVQYGMLFVCGDRLYVLYDTLGYNRWSRLREYDLQDPSNPALQTTESMDLPSSLNLVSHQDSLVFFEQSYYRFLILNLNTREFYTLNPGYTVYDCAHKDHYLFVSTYEGLRVWEISNLPDYIEVFNDSTRRSGAFLRLRDTILIDMYRYYDDYRVKVWNVRNPENPQIVSEYEQPNLPLQTQSIALTNRFLICFDYDGIYRYRHQMYDSLVYEDFLYLNQYYYDQKTSDSLIYLSFSNRIDIIRMDDFSMQQIVINEDWYYQILYVEIFDERTYVLVRKQGIYVLQRRAP